MYEVEKKFILKEGDEEALVKGAQSLGEFAFSDTYYDKSPYPLAKKDIWLRSRDGKWELKIGGNERGCDTKNFVDHYEEIETEGGIRKVLGIEHYSSLAEDLEREGYKPVATFTTKRRRYKSGKFNVDIDEASFGYRVAEIERVIEDRRNADKAAEEIAEFAKKRGLEGGSVHGKVMEYIKSHDPQNYAEITRAWAEASIH